MQYHFRRLAAPTVKLAEVDKAVPHISTRIVSSIHILIQVIPQGTLQAASAALMMPGTLLGAVRTRIVSSLLLWGRNLDMSSIVILPLVCRFLGGPSLDGVQYRLKTDLIRT